VRFNLEDCDAEELATEIAHWRPEAVVGLVKMVDQHMGEWDLVLQLKEWCDREYALYEREEREAAVETLEAAYAKEEVEEPRPQRCVQNPSTRVWRHASPHNGCGLR